MNSIKKLFITHNVGMIGGANKSLRALIMGLDEKVDLIAPIDYSVSDNMLRQFFGSNVNNVYRFNLPSRLSIEGYETKLDKFLYVQQKYERNKKQIYDLIEEKKYEFIHLNSYVLYPMLHKKYPMYIHIREIFRGNIFVKLYVEKYIENARGVFFIDYATKEKLNVSSKKYIILNNPFNQKKVLDVDIEKARKKYGVKNETIFLFVTDLALPVKGAEFIIETFLKANCEDAKLLIAGLSEIPEYSKKHNIMFLGKVQNMDELYAISDYVLRGEPFFALGRTVYEGLFSGCNVIIPGNESDRKKISGNCIFRDSIIFYPPRNQEKLILIFRTMVGNKKNKVLGLSNQKKYIEKFENFVKKTIY